MASATNSVTTGPAHVSGISPAFPLRVSANGRYLEDQEGRPYLLHADVGWRLCIRLTLDEAIYYLDDRKRKGFNTIFVHAINKEKEGMTNRAGVNPFTPDEEMTQPNEVYWKHVDDVLQAATQRGFLIGLSATWFGYAGKGWRKNITMENARGYGTFLGNRYRGFDNLFWILGGDNDPDGPDSKEEVTRELAAALRASAPHHLLTYHAGPEHASATFFGDDEWLDINLGYTYGSAYKHLLPEYNRPERMRPLLLGETGYEGESNRDFPWTADLVRSQAYWALLSGACGHAPGSRIIWHFGDGWQDALHYGATTQMHYLYRLFAPRAWWKLAPDQEHRLLTRGFHSLDDARNVVCACADDGSFALIYLPEQRTVTVDLSALTGSVIASWYDPTSGISVSAAESPLAQGSIARFSPPGRNQGGDEDWVLTLDANPSL